MQIRGEQNADWSQLSEFLASTMGLHFPPERWPDLRRGITEAAMEFGFDNVVACADWLLSAPLTKTQIEVLASHLTIGETYFFRETKTLDVLANSALPELIRLRRGGEQRLRLWSAACCSGEEAYSLAILLRQVLPDIADWQVTILATDINPRFLQKAVAGAYGEWSFRGTPAGFKERYFNRSEDGRFVVAPEIRQMVAFEYLNLVEDVYPALMTHTNAMDVILCRNVLMYFTPTQIRKVVGKFHRALLDGGWLAVSPCETSQELFAPLVTRNFPGVILYQKDDVQFHARQLSSSSLDEATDFVLPAHEPTWAPAIEISPSLEASSLAAVLEPSPTPYAQAAASYDQGRYADVTEILLAVAEKGRLDPSAFPLLVRALANQGRLFEALKWCDKWIAIDRLNTIAHYVRAVVLLEQAEPEDAGRSLQRAIYLDPDFVLAHFALGNLARNAGKSDEAAKHFSNVSKLLALLPPNDLLPESDGLTAGRLAETILALTSREIAQ